ncbi:hypothetical protein WN51_05950 [Melipona quadrifasciata]|uniref:Uncharacterized protein n=1 Tax=Melipona quadrifasciata TaxID=166423 RepID=A0A0N0BIR8_9HYME|nr:hypothetical protein WN51_05950 [Melipona quadrifasciata]
MESELRGAQHISGNRTDKSTSYIDVVGELSIQQRFVMDSALSCDKSGQLNSTRQASCKKLKSRSQMVKLTINDRNNNIIVIHFPRQWIPADLSDAGISGKFDRLMREACSSIVARDVVRFVVQQKSSLVHAVFQQNEFDGSIFGKHEKLVSFNISEMERYGNKLKGKYVMCRKRNGRRGMQEMCNKRLASFYQCFKLDDHQTKYLECDWPTGRIEFQQVNFDVKSALNKLNKSHHNQVYNYAATVLTSNVSSLLNRERERRLMSQIDFATSELNALCFISDHPSQPLELATILETCSTAYSPPSAFAFYQKQSAKAERPSLPSTLSSTSVRTSEASISHVDNTTSRIKLFKLATFKNLVSSGNGAVRLMNRFANINFTTDEDVKFWGPFFFAEQSKIFFELFGVMKVDRQLPKREVLERFCSSLRHFVSIIKENRTMCSNRIHLCKTRASEGEGSSDRLARLARKNEPKKRFFGWPWVVFVGTRELDKTNNATSAKHLFALSVISIHGVNTAQSREASQTKRKKKHAKALCIMAGRRGCGGSSLTACSGEITGSLRKASFIPASQQTSNRANDRFGRRLIVGKVASTKRVISTQVTLKTAVEEKKLAKILENTKLEVLERLENQKLFIDIPCFSNKSRNVEKYVARVEKEILTNRRMKFPAFWNLLLGTDIWNMWHVDSKSEEDLLIYMYEKRKDLNDSGEPIAEEKRRQEAGQGIKEKEEKNRRDTKAKTKLELQWLKSNQIGVETFPKFNKTCPVERQSTTSITILTPRRDCKKTKWNSAAVNLVHHVIVSESTEEQDQDQRECLHALHYWPIESKILNFNKQQTRLLSYASVASLVLCLCKLYPSTCKNVEELYHRKETGSSGVVVSMKMNIDENDHLINTSSYLTRPRVTSKYIISSTFDQMAKPIVRQRFRTSNSESPTMDNEETGWKEYLSVRKEKREKHRIRSYFREGSTVITRFDEKYQSVELEDWIIRRPSTT